MESRMQAFRELLALLAPGDGSVFPFYTVKDCKISELKNLLNHGGDSSI